MSVLVAYTTNPDSQANRQALAQQSSRSAAYDPVEKLRVSQPQALIDTDFEYGTQPTGTALKPSIFTTSLTASNFTVTVNTRFPHNLSAGAGIVVAGITTLDLSSVRDIGNSILGGGTSNTVPTSQSGLYPDGPDILYVVATPNSATAGTIQARISWKEAQA